MGKDGNPNEVWKRRRGGKKVDKLVGGKDKDSHPLKGLAGENIHSKEK